MKVLGDKNCSESGVGGRTGPWFAGAASGISHLLHVLIEEVEDAVLVLPIPPPLHVVIPGTPEHCGRQVVSGQLETCRAARNS